mgnify:CR=1 FL=1
MARTNAMASPEASGDFGPGLEVYGDYGSLPLQLQPYTAAATASVLHDSEH